MRLISHQTATGQLKDLREKGLKVYAVDLEESKETIQPVAAKLIPDVPVLLDENSAVSKKFGVSGIPQTRVIATST